MEYYQDELSKVIVSADKATAIKVQGDSSDTSTKWLNLNEDSAKALVSWLQANYNTKPTNAPNQHVLTVKYMGATNTRGSRVKITSERFKQSISIPYDHALNTALDIADNWLKSKGFGIVSHGEGKDHMYIITDTFEPLK